MSEFRKISLDNTIVQTNKSFLITRAGLQALRGQLIQIPEIETEDSVGVSKLNTPVIDNLIFQANGWFELDGTEVRYEELRIDTVIIEVAQTKNIRKTSIQGRTGTVKEYISDDDYIISIRGVIGHLSKVYPESDVKKIREICKAQRSLEVTSKFLNDIFDIKDIVIESYNIPQVEGVRNQQPFSITASSDVPIDLEELEL